MLGQHGAGALHIARGEIQKRLCGLRRVVLRADKPVAAFVHVFEKPAHIAGGQVGFQRPRGIRVAEGHKHIWQTREHHAFVSQCVAGHKRFAVDMNGDIGQYIQLQAGGNHHDVGLYKTPVLQADAVSFKTRNLPCLHTGFAFAYLLEQITIWHGTHALVPRRIARCEMRGHVIVAAQGFLHHADQIIFEEKWFASGQLEINNALQNVAPANKAITQIKRQKTVQPNAQCFLRRAGHHIGRRALQHRHMRCAFRHGRHNRHRSRTAANHHDAFICIRQSFRPKLRINQRPLKTFLPVKMRLMPLRVAVIAAAHVQKTRLLCVRAAVGQLRGHAPASVL